MNVNLSLTPETGLLLGERARHEGYTLEAYLQRLIEREVRRNGGAPLTPAEPAGGAEEEDDDDRPWRGVFAPSPGEQVTHGLIVPIDTLPKQEHVPDLSWMRLHDDDE